MKIKQLKFEESEHCPNLYRAIGLNGKYEYEKTYYKQEKKEKYSLCLELSFKEIVLIVIFDTSEKAHTLIEAFAQKHHEEQLSNYLEEA